METIKFEFINMVSSYIKNYFRNISFDVADFIGCQFALESAYGHSSLAHDRQNYCGMKTPLIRISTALNAGCSSSSDQFAKYRDLYSCIVDYILWLQFRKPMAKELNSINLFVSLIRPYCPDQDYTDKINLIYLQFKSYQNVFTKSNSKD